VPTLTALATDLTVSNPTTDKRRFRVHEMSIVIFNWKPIESISTVIPGLHTQRDIEAYGEGLKQRMVPKGFARHSGVTQGTTCRL